MCDATASTGRRIATSANRPRYSWGSRWSQLNQIVLHLGNGASAAAIAGGRAVDTLDGSDAAGGPGDGHPQRRSSTPAWCATSGARPRWVSTRSSRCSTIASGMLGLVRRASISAGVHELIESGDAAAQLAYDVFIHRLRKYIGAYLAIAGQHRRDHVHGGSR